MKAVSVFTVLLILVAGGLAAKIYFDERDKALEYPLHRTLTSSDGRTLDVVIHGRTESALVIERLNDGNVFHLDITNLSTDDQALAGQLPVNRFEPGGQQSVSKTPQSDDPYIQSRLDSISKLQSRLVALENEIDSGSLNSMLLKNREDELARVEAEITELQSAIKQYKYRNKIQ